ncbi:MAG: NAD(P)H-dependent glycerol-3-phosphate dehydrogenase [Anaeromicrobium sp.]|jgi:glycerol-3-phosphate dehydrogenase (NAD(P)+)|uniref:NAD(P)H-dependent glycerol-3-phosphate dehydrogenase n=1 Tax=Anaeromicrobium sp. TaxID=1929132 RepID=UPI0025E862E3|nr:NAD(P)H-dependent glycerol-3-phosphate dehydrogenase [Anaeromicrobium sp.]MCT4592903.1 NAD(P)H-dependent glycerol-3-phosphate dehydrogenase [Anaeromicrobium sp.]
MKKINVGVIGAGSWGSALAISLAKKGHRVNLWVRQEDLFNKIKKSRENIKYLPGVLFPENIKLYNHIDDTVKDMDLILVSVSSQAVRNVLELCKDNIKEEAVIVNVAKGLEKGTLLRISQVVKEILPKNKYCVLSGPSHAEEVSRHMPTTLVAASHSKECAEFVQDVFITPKLRVYTNPDVVGVELGGALKNVIALGAGISDGLGYGDNAKAALMTRGIREISRLGQVMGASISTFSGLTGIGDLIVTCTSMHSRNRRCGIKLGQGMEVNEAVESIGMVVEGITTTNVAYDLSKKYNVDMPITREIYRILNEKRDAKEAVVKLMMRSKTHEIEEVVNDIVWKER